MKSANLQEQAGAQSQVGTAHEAVRKGSPRRGDPAKRAIRREIRDGQICVLTFDRPDSAANIFDEATLRELSEHLDFAAASSQLTGLVLFSAKPSIFIAGADLTTFERIKTPEDLRGLIDLGQSVFNRLAALRIPTAAAIHGAAVGGGYEICVACDYRVASPDRATRIGLPETQIGLLPAWGGCTRLPRLIGLPKALEVILAGKTLPPKPALKRGMIDEIAPRESLLEAACEKIRRGKPRRSARLLTNNALVAALLRLRLRPQLLRSTRGHYPAVLKALDVVTKGVCKTKERSLALEREAILQLAGLETTRNLVRVFFLQERAKKLKVGQAAPVALRAVGRYGPEAGEQKTGETPVRCCAVIGAGVMGSGIAQWLSARGLRVILRDVKPEYVARGMVNIARLFEEGVNRHVFTPIEARDGMDRIHPTAADVPLNRVDLVVEAAIETLALKKEIFGKLSTGAQPDTVLATNTSALSITEIASATRNPERVVGLHFFNPVHRMQLVEVVQGRQTSAETLARAVRFVHQIGKLPVVVKDSPGFLVNRILMPYLVEAGHLFEAGAGVGDLDAVMLDFGMPMGPMRLLDEVGLDVALHVAETLAGKFAERLRVPDVLGGMVQAGLLGRKAGGGFYLHRGSKPRVNRGADKFRLSGAARTFTRAELQERMVLLMVNEAARCLEEQIVSGPADVDFAMIMGTGFAPFRGGPLRYADALGTAALVERLNGWVARGASQFQPCALLQSLAARGEKFYAKKGEAA